MMNSAIIKLTLVFGLAFPAQVWAASCEIKAGEAKTQCDSGKLQKVRDMQAACKKQVADGKGITLTDETKKGLEEVGLLTSVKNCNNLMESSAKPEVQQFIDKCSEAINQCESACAAEEAIPGKGVAAAEKKKECTTGEPAQNRDAAKADLGQIMQMIAALAALLMMLMGQKKEEKKADKVDCVKEPYDPKCKQDVAAKDSTTTFTSGEMRSPSGGGDFLDSGLSGQAPIATGAPAAATLSGPMPGGSPGGAGGMAGAGAGGFGGKGEKKAEGDGAPKINLASTPGGSGGNSGIGGGGRSGAMPGSGAAAARSALDNQQQLAAAVEKAVQQRGVASEGPLGGISAAHSLDNFQKVEKRIQSERNQLNEF